MSKGRGEPYKVLTISMYVSDIKKADEKVARLRQRGMSQATRSALIRYALSTVDPALVPEKAMRRD